MSKVKKHTFPPSVIFQDGEGTSFELPIQFFGGRLSVEPTDDGYRVGYVGGWGKNSVTRFYCEETRRDTLFEAADAMLDRVNNLRVIIKVAGK